MAKLRKVPWGKCLLFVSIACSVLAQRKLDTPGYTRQFIYRVNNDCQDFKAVRDKCHVWKDMGFCFKYRREMQHVCNRTCQYCVPGQKQWQVVNVKGVWGRVHNPTSAHALPATPPSRLVQNRRPLVQILGKERPVQTDDAADAIASQMQTAEHSTQAFIKPQAVSPQILGTLPVVPNNAIIQTTVVHNTTTTENNESKGAQPTSSPAEPVTPEKPENAISGLPTTQGDGQSTIAGTTQVGESSKERHPVVVLMGYELGEKSSNKVHEVLKNTAPSQQSDSGTSVDGSHRELTLANDRLMSSQKVAPFAKPSTESMFSDSVPTDETQQGRKNDTNSAVQEGGSPQELPDLDELAELLDSAAAIKQHMNDHNNMHEENNTLNVKTAIRVDPHAVVSESRDGKIPEANGKVPEADGKIPEARGSTTDVILPVSTDLKALVDRVVPNTGNLHGGTDTPGINSTSMSNHTVKLNGSLAIRAGSLKIEAGNKHGDINDPNLQMNTPLNQLQKTGKQVTLTINERPGTGEAVFQVENSPHATGLAYTTDRVAGKMPPSNYLLMNENQQARAKTNEEEQKIREATHSIRDVLKLFNHRNMQGKLIQQATQDFPANSKSEDASPDLAGIQSALEAGTQGQDHAGTKAQDLARQISQVLSPSGGTGTGPLEPFGDPNYAVISTSDSQDWKNLARVLATQLKHVLNHMEDRERENSFEKTKMREEMLMLTRQQMMGREDDEDPDEEDEDDDDYDRERRRHAVMNPGLKQKNLFKKPAKSANVKSKGTFKSKTKRKYISHKLLRGAIKKLSRLEKIHKKG